MTDRNSNAELPFTVRMGDNFHYGDEDEVSEHGKFATLEAAMTACKKIVDAFLLSVLKPGMTADELFSQYTMFGDDPYIVGSDQPGVPFSAWTYAKARCAELCGSRRKLP